MKTTVHFLCLLLSVIAYSQKEIQPYQYSEPDNDITFFIYAEPETVNNINFTFKNSKGEPILIDNKPFSFKVYPLQERTFTEALKGLLEKLKNEAKKSEELKIFETLTTPKNNYDLRNIYQFFNGLINTAFEYDTEPVAGVLKYDLETEVLKKTIEGLDTNLFFTKKAKIIRKVILDTKDITVSNIEENKNIKNDSFLKNLDEESIQELIDFNKNTQKYKKHKARNKFKHYSKKFLQKKYNALEIKKILDNKEVVEKGTNNSKKGKSFSSYYLDILNTLKELEKKKNKFSNSIKKFNDSINKYKNLTFENFTTQLNFNEYQLSILKKEKITLEKEKISLQNKRKSLKKESEIKANDDQLISNENKIKRITSNIEFEENEIKNLEDLIVYEKKQNIEKQHRINYLKKERNTLKDSLIENEKNKQEKVNEKEKVLAETAILLQKIPLWKFKASLVELDINDGFIEHMVVVGKLIKPVLQEDYIRRLLNNSSQTNNTSDITLENAFNTFFEERIIRKTMEDSFGKELKFDNEFPIGFSSKIDFADLHNYTLFNFEGYEKKFSLPITNIITNYIQRHQNDRLDFSPKDQVVTLPLQDTDNNGAKELKKEKSSKILSAKVFSDFNGFREETPNGLIQFEVDKKIPIWTKRFFLGAGRSSNFGVLNYANFNFTWAKTEERDRNLQVRTDQTTNERFATYLDFIRFQNTSFGGDLNIASFSFPIAKARLEINGGLHYNRVNVVDTLSTNTTLPNFSKQTNTIRIYPDFILRIRPEERFGGYFRFRPTRLSIPASKNESFFVVDSDDNAKGNEQALIDRMNNTQLPVEGNSITTNFNGQSQIGWIYRYEFSSFFQPSAKSDSKFFFRYRYTNDKDFSSNGYSEFQVGYLMFLKF